VQHIVIDTNRTEVRTWRRFEMQTEFSVWSVWGGWEAVGWK